MGLGGTTLSLAGLAEGTVRAGPAIAAVLLNTAPFFVAVIARLTLDERVTALRALGLAVGFAGVLVIILAGGSSSGEDVVVGSILTLLGAIGYGCAGLLVRYLALTGEPFDVIGIMAAQFLCGGVLLLPYLFLSGDLGASDWGSPELWWSIAFIVVGAQVLAYLTFNIALTRWPGSRVYPWAFLAPVVAIVIEAFRGNLPGAWSTVGMAVVVAGIVIVNLPAAEAPARPAPAATALDLDVAEHARRGEPVDLRIRVAALPDEHLARVLAAPRRRAQLGQPPVDAQRRADLAHGAEHGMLGLGDQVARDRLRIADGAGHVVDRAARDAGRAQPLEPRRRAVGQQHGGDLARRTPRGCSWRAAMREKRGSLGHPLEPELAAQQVEELVLRAADHDPAVGACGSSGTARSTGARSWRCAPARSRARGARSRRTC